MKRWRRLLLPLESLGPFSRDFDAGEFWKCRSISKQNDDTFYPIGKWSNHGAPSRLVPKFIHVDRDTSTKWQRLA